MAGNLYTLSIRSYKCLKAFLADQGSFHIETVSDSAVCRGDTMLMSTCLATELTSI